MSISNILKLIITYCLSLVIIFSICACSKGSTQDKTNFSTNQSLDIIGAGASFPAIIYSSWSVAYYKTFAKRVNYQSIGSSAGMKQLDSNTIDFGASDAPLTEENLKNKNYFQFPTVIGGIVMIVNLEGIKAGELTLNGPVIADIYLGKIKKWNDSQIQKLNPNLHLPNNPIIVVHRSDGSGTTYVFTKFLTQISNDWKQQFGFAQSIGWLIGIGGKGNDGVATSVKTLKNSIGYVEFAYAKQNKLIYTKLINISGQVVSPNPDSFSLAGADLNWEESFAQDLINNPNPGAWPIVTTTYIVIPKQSKNENKIKTILAFFDWSFGTEGKNIVSSLQFVPLPPNLVELIRSNWQSKLINSQGKPIYHKKVDGQYE